MWANVKFVVRTSGRRNEPFRSIRHKGGPPATATQPTPKSFQTSSRALDQPRAVKAVMEHLATVGYKELSESGEFVVPGFVKMSVINKSATEARSGINPFTKEPMEFAAKPASKTVKASPLKVVKDAV